MARVYKNIVLPSPHTPSSCLATINALRNTINTHGYLSTTEMAQLSELVTLAMKHKHSYSYTLSPLETRETSSPCTLYTPAAVTPNINIQQGTVLAKSVMEKWADRDETRMRMATNNNPYNSVDINALIFTINELSNHLHNAQMGSGLPAIGLGFPTISSTQLYLTVEKRPSAPNETFAYINNSITITRSPDETTISPIYSVYYHAIATRPTDNIDSVVQIHPQLQLGVGRKTGDLTSVESAATQRFVRFGMAIAAPQLPTDTVGFKAGFKLDNNYYANNPNSNAVIQVFFAGQGYQVRVKDLYEGSLMVVDPGTPPPPPPSSTSSPDNLEIGNLITGLTHISEVDPTTTKRWLPTGAWYSKTQYPLLYNKLKDASPLADGTQTSSLQEIGSFGLGELVNQNGWYYWGVWDYSDGLFLYLDQFFATNNVNPVRVCGYSKNPSTGVYQKRVLSIPYDENPTQTQFISNTWPNEPYFWRSLYGRAIIVNNNTSQTRIRVSTNNMLTSYVDNGFVTNPSRRVSARSMVQTSNYKILATSLEGGTPIIGTLNPATSIITWSNITVPGLPNVNWYGAKTNSSSTTMMAMVSSTQVAIIDLNPATGMPISCRITTVPSSDWQFMTYNVDKDVWLVMNFTGSAVLRSTDNGSTWTVVNTGVGAGSGYIRKCDYGMGSYVGVHMYGSGGGQYITSTDGGLTWTRKTLVTWGEYWDGVAYGDGMFLSTCLWGKGVVILAPENTNLRYDSPNFYVNKGSVNNTGPYLEWIGADDNA